MSSRWISLRVTDYEDDVSNIDALCIWGPDVGEAPDVESTQFVDPALVRLVQEAISRYPESRLLPGRDVHGLAAVAAIGVVEKWLLERDGT